jgi:hypothetical protein
MNKSIIRSVSLTPFLLLEAKKHRVSLSDACRIGIQVKLAEYGVVGYEVFQLSNEKILKLSELLSNCQLKLEEVDKNEHISKQKSLNKFG